MNTDKQMEFHTIRDIRQQRENVLSDIRKDSDQMETLWKGMFKHEQKKKGLTVASVLNTGTGLLDGLLLVWKLYRKFKR